MERRRRALSAHAHMMFENPCGKNQPPRPSVVARHRQVCEGDARSFNQLNHEVSIDDTSNEVLTLAYNIRDEYGAWTSLLALDEGLAYKWKDAHGESMAVKYVLTIVVQGSSANNIPTFPRGAPAGWLRATLMCLHCSLMG